MDSIPQNIPDIDPDALRKLMQSIQGAYELQQVNEQLRLELIETKQKLEAKPPVSLMDYRLAIGTVENTERTNRGHMMTLTRQGGESFVAQLPDAPLEYDEGDLLLIFMKWDGRSWVAKYIEILE